MNESCVLHNITQRYITRLQLLLAMAHNLSIGTRRKNESEGEQVPKRAKNCLKIHKKVLQSAHDKRVCVSRMSVSILPSSRLISARNAVKFWQAFVMSTTSNQFESHIFWSNFLKLVVAAQDYDILHSRHFPEIPGWPKWTFSSPWSFKLLSGEPKIIQLVTWYHVLFLGPWSINFLFQNTRKVIRLSATKLQTHLTPPPAGRQLDWVGGCLTGTMPFKDKEKRTVKYLYCFYWKVNSCLPTTSRGGGRVFWGVMGS